MSLSIGVSALPPGRSVTLEELIDAADEGMYEDKRAKRESAGRLVHLEPVRTAGRPPTELKIPPPGFEIARLRAPDRGCPGLSRSSPVP